MNGDGESQTNALVNFLDGQHRHEEIGVIDHPAPLRYIGITAGTGHLAEDVRVENVFHPFAVV
jgi:hypothetical protein